MRRLFLIVGLMTLQAVVFGQVPIDYKNYFECQKDWKYIDLKETIKGNILFHKKQIVACGTLSTASTTIVLTEKGDTIRVLELCNITKDFKVGTKVQIKPQQKPPFVVDLIPYDPQACIIKEAYFGAIEQLDN